MSFTLWITYGASLTPDVIETGSLAEILLSASGYTGEGYEDAHVDIFEPGATRPTALFREWAGDLRAARPSERRVQATWLALLHACRGNAEQARACLEVPPVALTESFSQLVVIHRSALEEALEDPEAFGGV